MNTIETFRPVSRQPYRRVRISRFIGICLTFLISITPTVADAATYYVDDVNGVDSAAGSSADPWKTLQKAQSVVVSGDTVYVRNGSYGAYSEAGVDRTHWVTYRAEKGNTPELTSIGIDNQGRLYDTYLVFDGFIIRPAVIDTKAISIRNTKHTKFLNLKVLGQGLEHTSYGLTCWGNYSPIDITIDGCTFSGGDKTGRCDGFNHAIDVSDADYITITNNEIKQFHGAGVMSRCVHSTIANNNIHYFGADAGIGVGAGSGPMLVENNKVYDCRLYQPTDPTHTDLIQVYAYADISNLTIRRNQFYDTDGAFGNISPYPKHGSNFLIENNLFWNTYTQAEGTNLWIDDISGLNLRNNTIIGGLLLTDCANAAMSGNIISYMTATSTAGLIKENYNIFNRGNIDKSFAIGSRTIYLNPGLNPDKWNDPAFTGIFTDYTRGDFSHASANSLGVGHGDPCNFPTTDILNVTRDAHPDAGCYEYVISAPGNTPPRRLRQ